MTPESVSKRRSRRVPFVQQLGADDCGASCLAMVLGAHGVHDVAAECRALCGGGRDGSRLRTLAAVATRYGLTSRMVASSPIDVGSFPLPAIAHWKSRHFVVVERWTKKRVTLVDPAVGRMVVSLAEFAEGYSGVALLCEPGPTLVPSAKRRVPLWLDYLVAMFNDVGARGTLAQVVMGSLLLQAVGLATPLFTKLIVDDVAPPGGSLTLGVLAVGMFIVVVGRTIVTFVRSAIMIRLQVSLDARLTEGFFRHLLRLPYQFFQGRSSGDLLMRLSSNALIRDMLTAQLIAVMLDGPFAILYLVLLFAIAPSFGGLVLALAVVQGVLVLVSLRPLVDLGQRGLAAKSDEQSCLVELMKGIAHLKAAGAEQPAYERWVALFRRQLAVAIDRGLFTAKVEIALGFLRTASPLVLLWYGAHLVIAGKLPLGTMLALGGLAAAFLMPFLALVQSSQQLQLLDAYVERLVDVLRVEPELRVAPLAISAKSFELSGELEARNLSFRFSPDGPLVVDNLSFHLAAGQTLGIVGATGSGKSTILMLLLGLYTPTGGDVLYDGVSLSELDPYLVRRRCGVVLQDVALFAGSLRSNIALNVPECSVEDVAAAARVAGLEQDVARMALRYETRLAEGGSNLSGGQRQRIAIARATIARPAILLLDEATSHLDVAAEQHVIRNLDALSCTRVVVAHRLTAVRSASQILVLEHGRVVERGTHHDLTRRGGVYADLVSRQTPMASGRWPGADSPVARIERMVGLHHGHRGWRASI